MTAADVTGQLAEAPCRFCGTAMDPDRPWWWTGYGATCSDVCARDLIRDHEGGANQRASLHTRAAAVRDGQTGGGQ